MEKNRKIEKCNLVDDCGESCDNNVVFAEFVDVNGAVETVVTKFFLFSASAEAMVADDVGFCSK